jgi:hypothetical protein
MGVLDDAIREHLDLKRKHGVSEEEVQRQEVEALGPARRDVSRDQDEPAEGDAAAVEAEVDEGELSPEADAAELAEAEVPEAAAAEPEVAAEAADAAPPVADAMPPESTAPAEDAPAEPTDDDTVLFDAENEAFPEPAPADAPTGDTPESGFAPVEPVEEPEEPEEPEKVDSGATQEYDPFADEEEPEAEPPADAAEGEDEEGDVLEDTPDFLQETPEHDRLWFEQKPPRDFDFD